MERRKKILVAQLDWGLGHATRCIPIINELLACNCEVLLASNGSSLSLLKEQLPNLTAFELPGYDPIYPTGSGMVFKMALQVPKFFKTILREHILIERLVAENNIDVIISDNRYGCLSKKAKSIFITHQLNILIPDNIQWLEKRINHFNQEQIKQYAECWVPAPPDSFIPKLTGDDKTLKTRYIGYLSRFEKRVTPKLYDVLVICSGPEPQRDIFEKLLTRQLQSSGLKYLIVKGQPNSKTASNNDTEVDFMNSETLNAAIESSEIIIARSGYTTVMDLAKLRTKAVFIPTPGQTEQEYIAEEMRERKIAFSMKQSEFNLKTALKESINYTGFLNFEYDDSLLKKAIQSIL